MRLAVFASGSGTNMQAIFDAQAEGYLPATTVLCVSNNATAGALDRAERATVPTLVLDPAAFDTEEAYAEKLLRHLQERDVDFIALAGYLRKIPEPVVATYRHRMTNIHPSLLPAFGGRGMYGRRVHEAVLAYGVHWTGATVHLVDAEYDTGPIVLQEPVRVQPDDTPETLAARVLAVEHRLYPEALRLFATARLHISGRHVRRAEPPETP